MAYLLAWRRAIAKHEAAIYFSLVTRLLMLLMFGVSLLLPMGPGQFGSKAAVSHNACHESGRDKPDQPSDRQAVHICVGCALPSMKIELAVPKPAGDETPCWPSVEALPGMMSAVDPPPPRG